VATFLAWPDKDPDEVLDYGHKWLNRLTVEGVVDTISTSIWILPFGIVQGPIAPSISGTNTILWLQGGTLGTKYTITNRITTSGGRTMDQSFTLKIGTK
jgi:hypothetical protein